VLARFNCAILIHTLPGVKTLLCLYYH